MKGPRSPVEVTFVQSPKRRVPHGTLVEVEGSWLRSPARLALAKGDGLLTTRNLSPAAQRLSFDLRFHPIPATRRLLDMRSRYACARRVSTAAKVDICSVCNGDAIALGAMLDSSLFS